MNDKPTIKPINVDNPFVGYIAKTIPLAFDESMSYYEVLCNLKQLVGETITSLNNTNNGFSELQNLFNQLEDYVNNYFTNLDVQEEINKKLDDMSRDGSLTNLIDDYLTPYIEQQNSTINNFINESTNDITNFKNNTTNDITNFKNTINNQMSVLESGSPLVASSTQEMTDTSRVYVNTTDGNWYYYDGDSWEIGGVYQATEDSDTVNLLKSAFELVDNNNYCSNIPDFYGSTLYEPVYLEQGQIYKVANPNADTLGGVTITIVGEHDNTIVTLITTNYFYPDAHLPRQNFKWTETTGWYRLRFNISGVLSDADKEMYGYGWVVAKIEDITSTKTITEYVPMGKSVKELLVNAVSSTTTKYVDNKNANISCWGDSLTYGYGAEHGVTDYPTVLKGLLNNEREVFNGGISGEETVKILARQGCYPAIINNVTIPANTTPVEISFYNDSLNIGTNNPTVIGENGNLSIINPVLIKDIKGNLNYNNNVLTFTRLESGTSLTVDRPTPIISENALLHKNDIQVIFMGTNGGWMITNDDAETRLKKLISQIDLMIDYNTSKKFIIVGMHYYYSWILYNGLTIEMVENALIQKYGHHYINLRKYMIEYGLQDANITPTEDDEEAISNGEVPPSLLISDKLHGNQYFYRILANLVYKRGIELNYWD